MMRQPISPRLLAAARAGSLSWSRNEQWFVSPDQAAQAEALRGRSGLCRLGTGHEALPIEHLSDDPQWPRIDHQQAHSEQNRDLEGGVDHTDTQQHDHAKPSWRKAIAPLGAFRIILPRLGLWTMLGRMIACADRETGDYIECTHRLPE
jgi:hypothetical protein